MIISLVLDMNDGRAHPAAGSSADEHRFIRYTVAALEPFQILPGISVTISTDIVMTHGPVLLAL